MRKASALRASAVVALVVMTLPFASDRAAAACGAAGTPTTTIYLPNITKTLGGPSGWVTPFIVQNVGTTSTNLEVSFFRFSDGSLVTCRTVPALAPGTSFADFPNADTDLPADTQFAVVVKSFGASVVSVVNEHQRLDDPAHQEALSYVGLSSGATKAYLPYVAKFVGGWLTTFVVQNLGPAFANVTITATSYDGTKNATLVRQIGPGRSAAIDPSVEPLLVSGTEYAIVLSADQPIAAIANAQNDAPGVAAPMGFSYNAVAQPQVAPSFVPAVSKNADGVGRTTRLLVQNADTADAAPTLTFRNAAGGVAASVTAPTAIRPGAAWSYQPTALADGTYALTVSGGAFAVVAASLTTTTAMGVIASAGTGNRAYLPNITRTLGGANGWTTPIVLQSTGATSATLRWYRFSDGALITRQLVTGLVNGASVTIDPRVVAGLSDDTQYAVVADATGGTIAAIVTELNFQGGDGAMGYEGFAATVSPFPVTTAMSVLPAAASVITGGTQQLTATVKDQFDNPLTNTTVTWQVTPATLGTISGAGLFTAGNAAGSGTITASVGALSVNVALIVQLPQTRSLGGFNFVFQSVAGADVFVQDSISGADRSTILKQAPADVAQVQLDFARTYSTRPQIYVFATTPAFTQGLQSILGVSAAQAGLEGPAATGLWVDNNTGQGIGLDWQKQASVLPTTALRHELTHWMEHEIAPAADIPSWFDEGNARAEEFTVTGSDDLLVINKYGAASMAATNTLFALADMTTSSQWDARVGQGIAGSYQYYAAYAAVSFLRADLGNMSMRRILDLMAQGQTLESAYASVAGQPFTAFSAAYAQRVRLTAPSYPGIATANGTVRGPGVTIELYGFTPGAQVTITLNGPVPAVPSIVNVNAYGTFATRLDSQFPAGAYTIIATWSGGTVTAQATKASSVDIMSLEGGVMDVLRLPVDGE